MEEPISGQPVEAEVETEVVEQAQPPDGGGKGNVVKGIYELLNSDSAYSKYVPDTYEKFVQELSKSESYARGIHEMVASDEVYSQYLPATFEETVSYLGLGKPSVNPPSASGLASQQNGGAMPPAQAETSGELPSSAGQSISPEQSRNPDFGFQGVVENIGQPMQPRPQSEAQMLGQAARESLKAEREGETLGDEVSSSFLRGSAALGESLANTPAFIYDIAAMPQNYIADKFDMPWLKASSEKTAELYNLPDNKVAEYYHGLVEKSQNKFQEKYDKGVTDYIANDEYGKAFNLLANQIAESAPVSLSLMMGNAGGVSTSTSIIAPGLVFGAQKKKELDKEAPWMSENEKLNAAFMFGLTEGIFEQYGITKLGAVTRNVLKKNGKDAAKKIAEEGFKTSYGKIFKQYFGVGAENALQEAATQFAQNAIDKYSGAKPDLDLRKGVSDALIVGLGAGSLYSAVPASMQVAQTKKAKVEQERIRNEKLQLLNAVENPNLSDVAKGVIAEKIKKLNEEGADIEINERKHFETLPTESKNKLEALQTQETGISEALQQEGIEPEAKAVLEEKLAEIESEKETLLSSEQPTPTEATTTNQPNTTINEQGQSDNRSEAVGSQESAAESENGNGKENATQNEEVSQGAENAPASEYASLKDSEIENRMAEIEGDSNFRNEFSSLEKEMERRERASVFGVSLQDVNGAIDALIQKEKDKPNGFGAFIEKRDARESKDVANKYLDAKGLSDDQIKQDFTDAIMGNPESWYADGLKLRESINEATRRGINTSDLYRDVERLFEKDGFTKDEAKAVVAKKLQSIYSKQAPNESTKVKSIEQTQPVQEGGEGRVGDGAELAAEDSGRQEGGANKGKAASAIPAVVFHATEAKFEGLPKKAEVSKVSAFIEPSGIYYSTSEEGAKQATGKTEQQRVVEADFTPKNPLVIEDAQTDETYNAAYEQAQERVREEIGDEEYDLLDEAQDEELGRKVSDAFSKILIEQGYDSVVNKGNGDVIVLDESVVAQRAKGEAKAEVVKEKPAKKELTPEQVKRQDLRSLMEEIAEWNGMGKTWKQRRPAASRYSEISKKAKEHGLTLSRTMTKGGASIKASDAKGNEIKLAAIKKIADEGKTFWSNGTYSAQEGDGKLEFYDSNGDQIDPRSKEYKKPYTEYLKENAKEFSGDKEPVDINAIFENASDEFSAMNDFADKVISNGNAFDIAANFELIKQIDNNNSSEENINPEWQIAQAVGNISEADFNKYFDKNWLPKNSTWIKKGSTNLSLDTQVQELLGMPEMAQALGKLDEQDAINKIGDIIQAYPSGANSVPKGSQTEYVKQAKEKFKEITGVELNDVTAAEFELLEAELGQGNLDAEVYWNELTDEQKQTLTDEQQGAFTEGKSVDAKAEQAQSELSEIQGISGEISQQAKEVIAAMDETFNKKGQNFKASKKNLEATYGEKAKQAIDINRNFEKYYQQLVDKGVITKKEC